jgi:carbamoylphosphate synthase large subunit
MKKKTVVICEYISTGINYVDDVRARGYEPVLLEGTYVGTDEETIPEKEERDAINSRLRDSIRIIPENPDYNEVLRQIRELDPVLVIAGSEFGVPLATKLSEDLGLPGNPVSSIRSMTEKDAMQEALKKNGLRYIRGQVVKTEAEAESFFHSLGTEDVVVKRTRGAGTQGVYLCHGLDEVMNAVRESFNHRIINGDEEVGILIQERIFGTEYVVNTMSCNGEHFVNSVWKYDKIRMPNGTNAYNTAMTVKNLEVGHSALMRYACRVASAVGVKYGPIHGEYIVDEKGPVLIEVNCRPMGGRLRRKYVENIFGHHETDIALDSYLDPIKFRYDMTKPYRAGKFAAMKFFILKEDTEAYSAPIIQIAKQLRSYYTADFARVGREPVMTETRNLETSGGTVYLIHEDEQVVREECELLHLLETRYPRILYQEGSAEKNDLNVKSDLENVLRTGDCHGAIIILSDTVKDYEGVTVVNEKGLKDAYDSYEQGILDLSSPDSFSDLEGVIRAIFIFTGKIRNGGRILVPESTYLNLPYGIDGMEILLKIAGLRIEMPIGEMKSLLIASKQTGGPGN